MEARVKAWLRAKAREELKEAREELGEAKRMVKEYEHRVVDPTWSECSFVGDPPRDPKRPGKHIWGSKVTEWKRERTKMKKRVQELEMVVEALS